MTKLICLMPTYNKEKTISKAIESVIMQKTDFKFELIILDDCSNDLSNNIINKYQKKYPDIIKIIKNEKNLGLLKTISKGYKNLKDAEYFCVLDPDDYYLSDKKFQNAVDFLDKNKNYSIYMTNVLLKKENKEECCYKGTLLEKSFSYKDRKKHNYIFMQTSGVIYRNIYFKNGYNEEFDKISNYCFNESFRADGFRLEWYLKNSKAYFKNKIESVYNYNKKGLWSQLSYYEQLLTNAKIYCSCADFFKDEKKFYLKEAKFFYNKALNKMEKTEKEKNEKTIAEIHNKIYNQDKKITNFIKKIKEIFKRDKIK